MHIKRYTKKADYSYTLGVYPTLELLQKAPDKVTEVYLSEKGDSNQAFPKIQQICQQKNIHFEFNDKLLERISAKENTYALAVFNKYREQLDPRSNHVVLVNPSNMGNLGTILRTMVAFGFYDLAIIKPAADVFDPKVVAAAMGAMFQVRFEYFESFEEYQQAHQRNAYALVLNKEAKMITAVKFQAPYSLVFGNEGGGLTEDVVTKCQPVYIRQLGDIDSLNLGISVGVALFWARV